MDSHNSKKLTRDGKSVKSTDLFDSALFMSVEGMKSERNVLGYLSDVSFTSYSYPHGVEPWPEIPKLDKNLANPLSETPESNGNRLKSQFSIPESSRNRFESQCLTPAQNTAEVGTCDLFLSNLASNTHKPNKTGAGLENLGNTCYLNAVLQCFIHTVPFVHGILSDTHSVQCKGNKEGFCLRCTLHELVKLSFTSRNGVISPWKLVNNLSYFSRLQRSQQEDAHEFLETLLNSLDSCYEPMGKENVSSQSDNIVKQVFGGRIVSKVKCCKCAHISDTLEPSVDLSLEIGDANNLKTALQSFTKVEKIEDSEAKFTCEECKDKVFIEKQLAFDRVPEVATFHLKRFKTNGHIVQKIDKHVAFPLELDLLPFTARGKTNHMEELKYVLNAVVVHVGSSLSYGHYYCFIRLSPDTWCKFDDSNVVGVHEDDVLSQEAYILFYAKVGTTWFSSFIETQKYLCEKSSPDIGTSLSSPTLHKLFSCESSDGTGSKRCMVDNSNDKDNLQGMSISNQVNSSTPRKRRLEKDFDDLEASCSFREKNVPCSRDEQMLAEECFSGKKSRFASSVVSSAPADHDQSSIVASVLHPWIARTFRYS